MADEEIERETETEFEVGLRFGTGSLLPGGDIVANLRRRWTSRAQPVADAAVAAAGGADELAAALEASEDLDVLLSRAIAAAGASASATKRRLLARVVSQAVLDDAEVDDATLILIALEQLEVPHIRALETIHRVDQERIAEGHRPPIAAGAAREIDEVVSDSARQFPSALIRILLNTGLLDGGQSWDGAMVYITGLTSYGEEILRFLHEEDLEPPRSADAEDS